MEKQLLTKNTTKTLTPEQFNKLSIRKRKILIVEDVIKQINSGKILRVKARTYNNVKNLRFNSLSSAKEAIDAGALKCEACARGAMFLSSVKFKNKLNIHQFSNFDFHYKKRNYMSPNGVKGTKFLSEEFAEQEQSEIEVAFEGTLAVIFDYTSNPDMEIYNPCLQFRKDAIAKWKKTKKSYTRQEYILIQICKNIIKNNGKFKP